MILQVMASKAGEALLMLADHFTTNGGYLQVLFVYSAEFFCRKFAVQSMQ